MTKVSKIWVEEPIKKPIELLKCLQTLSATFSEIENKRNSAYSEIVLLSRDKYNNLDLMLCKKGNEDVTVWLGHFNDGVTE